MITLTKGINTYVNTVKIDMPNEVHYVSVEASVQGKTGGSKVYVTDKLLSNTGRRTYEMTTTQINGRPSDDASLVAEWLSQTYFTGLAVGGGTGGAGDASAANQVTQISIATSTEADIEAGNVILQEISDKGEAALVTEEHDYIKYNYTGTGNNKVLDTKVYKTGGAIGTTVATVTYTYDVDGDVDEKTKT